MAPKEALADESRGRESCEGAGGRNKIFIPLIGRRDSDSRERRYG